MAPPEERGQAKWVSGQDQLPRIELGQWVAAEFLHILPWRKESGEDSATKAPP